MLGASASSGLDDIRAAWSGGVLLSRVDQSSVPVLQEDARRFFPSATHIYLIRTIFLLKRGSDFTSSDRSNMIPSMLRSTVAIILLFLTSSANAGGSKGPWFYTSTLGTDGWIREAETTLVVPAQPANNKGYLALWLGMGTTSKDFIQGVVASNPHERDGQWNAFAYTLHPTGSVTEADHVFIQVGDHVTSHYIYNDATGKYDQSVKVNGKLVSTISTSSGHAESCYSGLECATDAPETCGLIPAHKWINTRIVVNQVDTEFYSSFGTRGGTTASEIYTSDGGTTWHIDEAHIPAYTFN
ncbi:hypothetical protein Tdes44962_MAKER06759 [Teratosphaeria destructans]|uniref:Uncharacterized protein n=1 Tax=Teratosphaeria destructans TaxID=418781 RepID=A0A9W7T144_9PEZI|nr:hypothetical protein Tdes44962_MAKER06759 [Teratosphaeria destructans]